MPHSTKAGRVVVAVIASFAAKLRIHLLWEASAADAVAWLVDWLCCGASVLDASAGLSVSCAVGVFAAAGVDQEA